MFYVVQTSKILHLWAPHPPLTDALAVVFLFLSFASAASCGQFLNSIFLFVSLSAPRTAVSQGARGTQNDIEFHSARST